MATIIARSAESVHWYQQDGTPQYTVIGRDGSNRPTTLRDARKFNLVPSVTTILKIMAKPGLEQWKMEQMLLAAMTLPKLDSEPEKDYIARIVADSKETGKQAAEAGTRIHESIEKHFAGEPNEHPEIASKVAQEISKHFNVPLNHPWMIERSFSHPMGFGGKIDMYCNGIVLDVKTKEFGPDDKVDAYDEHAMQLAAYRHGLEQPTARCANVFVSRTHPGVIRIIEWPENEIQKAWRMFECLLQFWKLKNNFGLEA